MKQDFRTFRPLDPPIDPFEDFHQPQTVADYWLTYLEFTTVSAVTACYQSFVFFVPKFIVLESLFFLEHHLDLLTFSKAYFFIG